MGKQPQRFRRLMRRALTILGGSLIIVGVGFASYIVYQLTWSNMVVDRQAAKIRLELQPGQEPTA